MLLFTAKPTGHDVCIWRWMIRFSQNRVSLGLMISIFALLVAIEAAETRSLNSTRLTLNVFAVEPSPEFNNILNLVQKSSVCLHWYSEKRIAYISKKYPATTDLFTYEEVLSKASSENDKELLIVTLHPAAADPTELPRSLTQDKKQVKALDTMRRYALPSLLNLKFGRTVLLGFGANGINHRVYRVLSDSQKMNRAVCPRHVSGRF